MRLAVSAIFVVSLATTNAWAGPAGDQDADDAARVGVDGGVAVYDFEDDNVDGELLKPEGANIASRARAKHASLITIRPHFIPELIKMANDV